MDTTIVPMEMRVTCVAVWELPHESIKKMSPGYEAVNVRLKVMPLLRVTRVTDIYIWGKTHHQRQCRLASAGKLVLQLVTIPSQRRLLVTKATVRTLGNILVTVIMPRHGHGRFQMPKSVTTPNFSDTNSANDSGYCGNNTPRQTGTSCHNDETIKSRVTISRNSGEYADVTQPRVHVTNVSFASDHQVDTVDGASEDEEADMLHSMHRRSPFRRSMPRRHNYHNLKNAYQSQVLFKQKQQSLQQQNQNQTLNIEVSIGVIFNDLDLQLH